MHGTMGIELDLVSKKIDKCVHHRPTLINPGHHHVAGCGIRPPRVSMVTAVAFDFEKAPTAASLTRWQRGGMKGMGAHDVCVCVCGGGSGGG